MSVRSGLGYDAAGSIVHPEITRIWEGLAQIMARGE
jgi:hypothetical protein